MVQKTSTDYLIEAASQEGMGVDRSCFGKVEPKPFMASLVKICA